jgi:hypothetical protein
MAGTAKRAKVARKTRSLIAQTFSALENDQLSVTDVLRSPPPCLGRVRVYDVLRRIPHLNRKGAETVLKHAKVWPLITMDNLTSDERSKILTALPPRVRRK